MRCLSKDRSQDIRKVAADTFVHLARTDLLTSRIASCPNLLEQLTALLSEVNCPDLQQSATCALWVLSSWDDGGTGVKIVICPGALEDTVTQSTETLPSSEDTTSGLSPVLEEKAAASDPVELSSPLVTPAPAPTTNYTETENLTLTKRKRKFRRKPAYRSDMRHLANLNYFDILCEPGQKESDCEQSVAAKTSSLHV